MEHIKNSRDPAEAKRVTIGVNGTNQKLKIVNITKQLKIILNKLSKEHLIYINE